MPCQLNSSVVVKFHACRFLTHQMNWLGLCCFFLVFCERSQTVDVMFAFPGEHVEFHVHVARQAEIP